MVLVLALDLSSRACRFRSDQAGCCGMIDLGVVDVVAYNGAADMTA